jgi:hypothetical protein
LGLRLVREALSELRDELVHLRREILEGFLIAALLIEVVPQARGELST